MTVLNYILNYCSVQNEKIVILVFGGSNSGVRKITIIFNFRNNGYGCCNCIYRGSARERIGHCNQVLHNSTM